MKYKDECLYKFMLNYSYAKMQKHASQQVKTHKRRGIVAIKIVFNHATKADSEASRLAKTNYKGHI